jgi:hypothetical protein
MVEMGKTRGGSLKEARRAAGWLRLIHGPGFREPMLFQPLLYGQDVWMAFIGQLQSLTHRSDDKPNRRWSAEPMEMIVFKPLKSLQHHRHPDEDVHLSATLGIVPMSP